MVILKSQYGESLLESLPGMGNHQKKTFIYHDFNNYPRTLLIQGDIETAMDNSCNNLFTLLFHSKPYYIKNMFEAQFLWKFGGPMPGKLFIDWGDEGHYAFAIHVDFFNLKGMNLHVASMLSGVISVACLNLPADLHYKPENLYLVDIIPGPKQPSVENLNHYIHPLMQDIALS